ncbi:hypothetical protein FSP39_017689 [Pinctada imbricata]|uniref:Uncharacterized protein n=1 Tax=Pinctada imbricata TaxID=66713 RepID=A0AA88XG50_PINIB|nr:hypothetical protein FSP39_017689 [Pinctada imbricata]
MVSNDTRKWTAVGTVTFMMLQAIFTSAVVLFVLLMPKSVTSWKILLTMDNIAVIIGIAASWYLLRAIVTSSYNPHSNTDPSYGLKTIFLWIFGIGLIAEVFLYLLIDLECLFFKGSVDVHFIDPTFLRISTIACFVLQLVAITKGKNRSIVFTWKEQISIYLIIFLNMDFWIKGTVEDINNLFLKEAFIESYNITNKTRDLVSRACFWESEFQNALKDLYPYTLPMQFEFQMLATVLLLGLKVTKNRYIAHSQNGIRNAFCTPGQRKYALGSVIIGIFAAIIFICFRLLMKFYFNNQDDGHVIMNLYLVSHTVFNTFNTILTVAAFKILKSRWNVRTQYRNVSTNEYVIVITGTFPILYYATLISFSNSTGEFIIRFVSSVSAIVSIHYQTVYVLCMNCYRTDSDVSHQDRCILTACLVSLGIGNMSYWVVNTFIELRNLQDWIVEVNRDWYLIRRLTDPLCTFYRFHISMEFYSQLKKLS